MDANTYGLSLDSIVKAGSDYLNSTNATKAAQSAANAQAASANAASAQSGSMVKIALIVGGVILVAVVGIFLFKRK